MFKEECVKHEGIIESVSDKTVKVKIIDLNGCQGCGAIGKCCFSKGDKNFEIDTEGQKFNIGDKVTVSYDKSLEYKALFFAYFLPFLIFTLTLIISLNLYDSELASGIITLFVLLLYFFLLSKFKAKLAKMFNFRIIK